MIMRNQNKKEKNKREHWFEFEFVCESGVYPETYNITYYEVRLFVKSAREGKYLIKNDFPNAWIIYEKRLDI